MADVTNRVVPTAHKVLGGEPRESVVEVMFGPQGQAYRPKVLSLARGRAACMTYGWRWRRHRDP